MSKFLNSKTFFILILVLLTAGIIFVIVSKDQPAGQSDQNLNNQNLAAPSSDQSIVPDNPVSAEELTQNYQTQVREILKKYFDKQEQTPLSSTLSADQKKTWSALALDIQNQLLALRLPGEYKQIHFQLVSNFGLIGDGLDKDFNTVKAATKEIDYLAKKYTWLTK